MYRDHELADAAFARIVEAAREGGFTLIASLDRQGPHELDKRDARKLANEATRMRAAAVLFELDDDLTAVAEVANWCGRASEDSWLRIEPG